MADDPTVNIDLDKLSNDALKERIELLKEKNKLDLTLFSGGSKPSGITATMDYGRLIYSIDNSSYTDYFELADTTNVALPIARTKSLGTDTSSKGDGTVVFQEILCISENL